MINKSISISILIILILMFIYFSNYNEHYQILENNKTTQSSNLPKTGIRQGSDPLDGQLFSDVIMYKNDPVLDGEIGVEKCIRQCKGMCVEYGITGDCFCFPTNYAEINKKDFEESIKELPPISPLQYA